MLKESVSLDTVPSFWRIIVNVERTKCCWNGVTFSVSEAAVAREHNPWVIHRGIRYWRTLFFLKSNREMFYQFQLPLMCICRCEYAGARATSRPHARTHTHIRTQVFSWGLLKLLYYNSLGCRSGKRITLQTWRLWVRICVCVRLL